MIIFGQELLAQKFSNRVFFELGISNKIHILRKYNLQPEIRNNYYTIKQGQYTWPSTILLNLNCGYKFLNGNELTFGIMQDEIEISYFAYIPNVITFTPSVVLGNAITKGYGGVSATNINLNYKNQIINCQSPNFKKDNFFKVLFNVGLSYIYKPNNGIENLTGSDGITVTAPDSNKVTVMFTGYVLPVEFKRSFKINTGLTFVFGKKDRETFAFTISYVSGRLDSFSSNYYFVQSETRITNNNGTKELFKSLASFQGKGNGIYFTLSKRLYPFKWRNDRIAKKMEKLKQ